MPKYLPKPVFQGIAIAIVCLVLLASLISVHNNQKKSALTPEMNKKLKHLIQTACTQALTAQQDNNPLMAIIHTCNAKAYLDACQFLSSNNLASVTNMLGINVEEDIKQKVHQTLQKNMRKVTAQYPKLAVKGGEHFAIGAGWVA